MQKLIKLKKINLMTNKKANRIGKSMNKNKGNIRIKLIVYKPK